MEMKRKIQVASAAVIANGLLALTALSPSVALANPCAIQQFCHFCANLAYCQSHALPGCTATSVTCTTVGGCLPGPSEVTICHYD
jgi:hypothetical protein